MNFANIFALFFEGIHTFSLILLYTYIYKETDQPDIWSVGHCLSEGKSQATSPLFYCNPDALRG